MAKKRCHQCSGELGLGVRFRRLWEGGGWKHLRFCSAYCEALDELASKCEPTVTGFAFSHLGRKQFALRMQKYFRPAKSGRLFLGKLYRS
jgi:hypothetical protein